MKTKNSAVWVVAAVLVIAVIGVAVYFGNTKTEKGAFKFVPSSNPAFSGDLAKKVLDSLPDFIISGYRQTMNNASPDGFLLHVEAMNIGKSCVRGDYSIKFIPAYRINGENIYMDALGRESTMLNGNYCPNKSMNWDAGGVKWRYPLSNFPLTKIKVITDSKNTITESNEKNSSNLYIRNIPPAHKVCLGTFLIFISCIHDETILWIRF